MIITIIIANKFYPFATSFILIFLLLRKPSYYLKKLNLLNNKSKIDILFLTIFFIFLFVPMSYINQDEISEEENRTLAKWQPLFCQGKINYNFGKNFDEWFNDRFYLKYTFTDSYNLIKSKITKIIKTKDGIYNKQTHWMFVNDKYWYDTIYDKQTQNEIIDNLNKFNSFCKKNNIKLYMLVVPCQQEVYYKEGCPHLSNPSARMKAVDRIAANTTFKTINFYNEIKEYSKNHQTYYKTDWHWTDEGVFIGYKILMNCIKKDFNNIKISSKDDFNITYTNKVRSDWERDFHNGKTMQYYFHEQEKEAENILDMEYGYYQHKNHKKLHSEIVDIPYRKEKIYHYDLGNNLRLMQIGTSMNESLLDFTPYSFKDLKYIRLIQVKDLPQKEWFKLSKHYESKILQFKPDIIILCLTPRDLQSIVDFYKE